MNDGCPKISKLYNKESLPSSAKAGEKLLEYFREHKRTVFPDERGAFLIPIIKFFEAVTPPPNKTQPRIIAEMAMQMADFRVSNTKDGYLNEGQLSRCIQKVVLSLKEEE